MKICKDCKYYYGSNFCTAPQNGQSLVTGDNNSAFAIINRNDDLKCGLIGAWFVEKKIIDSESKPWWKFWK